MSFVGMARRAPRKIFTGAALKISRIVDDASSRFKRRPETDLLIYDDYFPGLLSAFRIAEYNHYLESLRKAEVHSTRPCNFFFDSSGSFQEKLAEYSRCYPQLRTKVKKFNEKRFPRCRLAYTVFLNNAYHLVEHVERHDTPFAFTLYPGGGFYLGDSESDMKLRRVLSSPFFRKVFVTQKVTEEYLLQNRFCDREKIEFAYGGVLPIEQLLRGRVRKLRYKTDKPTFDICFVAAKYTERGVDKGYDTFIELAHLLCQKYQDLRFHVVGSFDATDIDVSRIRDKITFYGMRNTDFFPNFYSGMDIVLSPNRAFALSPGAFDGFPTGACVEAGLCGVAVMCSDPLNLNVAFADGEEIVIIPTDAVEIAKVVSRFYEDTAALYEVAGKGQKAFQKVFDLNAQMVARMKFLKSQVV